MTEHMRLGTIRGVAIGINWSVLVIFFLVVWGLAAGRFPAVYPDVPRVWHVVGALVAGVVFFVSLLAHELSHAVLATRNGLTVDGITLWMFGGIARLEGEAPDAGAELRISAVGPLVSAVLGAVFLGLAALAGTGDLTGSATIVVGVLQWLGLINVVLAVFNVMPAAPLDGGRILRAALWRWRGDRLQASINAARAGKAFGLLLIALGLFEFAFAAALGGLWLVFIGWFLFAAAGAEEQQAEIRGALADVAVRDVMSSDPLSAPPDLSVEEFLDEFVFRHRFSAYPLLDDGRLRGLVTLNRVRDVPRERRSAVTLADIACPPDDVPTARPGEPLADLLPRMSGCTDGRAIVMEDSAVVGIVSPSDIARRLEIADLSNPRDREHI